MALLLKSVEPARGARWVGDAFRLFARRPLAFTSLFVLFLFVALFSALVPLLGGVLQMMLLPLLSLGFMIASQSALTGGFLLGWGVMIWLLSIWVYDKAPEAVRKTVLIGILTWFVFDSSGSIASGNVSNALFNVLVLLLAVGPLWRPAQ